MRARLPSLAPYRLRILLRMAFLLLALATVGLAVSVLQQEKQLSYKNYQSNFHKTRDQISATLRHPAGQLALLNPPVAGASAALHPLLLPYSSLDFDDQYKVQQAVAMSGCLLQYGRNGSLCVGIGNNPWAGGFIYVAGSFDSAALVPHRRGDLTLEQAHRVALSVTLRGMRYRWIAPFEQIDDPAHAGLRGRLTGYEAGGAEQAHARPIKDFRGWIWQNPLCKRPEQDPGDSACVHSSFFSVRLPIGVLQDALFEKRRPVWPPEDLDRIAVSVAVLPPGGERPILDSKSDTATPAFSLSDLSALLLPGETLRISKLSSQPSRPPLQLAGPIGREDASWHVLSMLIRHLPVDAYDVPLESSETIAMPFGNYVVVLKGDVRSVNDSLSVVATRVSWFVGAMLLAILLAWLAIEIGIISRITILTKRADKVAKSIRGAGEVGQFDLADLRGADELGVLASCLYDLLRRVKEDVEREVIRTEQERDMWHAVGHEIMSPLQSLMVLHGAANEPSSRYILRMQQAIRVLYGSASPSEAFQSSTLQVTEVDIGAFLRDVAANAPCVGISEVEFSGPDEVVMARADSYSLEDVITHVLHNAERHRTPDSAITITLSASETAAGITIHNRGAGIAPELIDKIFEYGVSGPHEAESGGNRGQGLFVAKTYMAKMGGTIVALNTGDGVSFVLNLQRCDP
ncbi:MAG TPA: ATP-binding protein [Janthinobacterium sp.]|nr:ATP-binding protein [Janthinobacterium sp.]